jgi:signal peptidase I
MEENNMINTTEEEQDAVVTDAAETTKETVPEENTKKFDKKQFVGDILEIVESTLVTVFVIVMIFTYLLHPVNISGQSMEPTLHSDERIFMTTVYFGIDNGDILVIDNNAVYLIDDNGEPYKADIANNPLDECIIKRVIACGGQEIDIDDSDPTNTKVLVDGKVVDEPYIMAGANTAKSGAFAGKFPFTVPDGYYFVMGDNREKSSDSRSGYVGLIKKDQVYGKAIVRYSPLSKFKMLFNSDKESAN